MGNTTSTSASGKERSSSSRRSKKGSASVSSANQPAPGTAEEVAARAKKAVGESVRELQAGIQSGIKKLEEQDHPAAQLLDSFCGPYLDDSGISRKYPGNTSSSFYSDDDDDEEEEEDDDSGTVSEDDETTQTTEYQQRNAAQQKEQQQQQSRRGNGKKGAAPGLDKNKNNYSMDSQSYLSADYDEVTVETTDLKSRNNESEEDESRIVTSVEDAANNGNGANLKTPMASAFAKRCYFTKAGIGKTTQHYEGLTLTGNIVLMLAGAMKLKGCPTICDEDLRRVEQTYPNQFSRLPDELLLSSGWRRISKYCHFSNKPIPDGIPFFRKYNAMLCLCVAVCESE
jgi:hypothetical protein